MKTTQKNQSPDRFFKLSFLLPLAVFLFFIVKGITDPFVGPNAANFSVYSLIAHNFNQFGYITTKLAPVISVSQTLPAHPEYFFHHPTLLSVIISIFFRLLGESFWSARLVVVLFSFGSLLLTYKIGVEIVSKRFGVIAIVVMALTPATTLFGKMIGQESLVLFFWLAAVYTTMLFLKTKNTLYFLLCVLCVFLGVISDWPMVYFTASLLPLYLFCNKRKQGLFLIGFALAVLGLLLIYVYELRDGFWDLRNAAAMRSFFGLSEIPFWPVRWVVLHVIRLGVYFNPVFVIFALLYFWRVVKGLLRREFHQYDLIVAGFFFFGVFHLLLYAQASFTHPYLIYYLLPFVVFAASRYILEVFEKKQLLRFTLVIFASVVYLLVIDTYKTNQIHTHLWRYEVIKKVSRHLQPYETILVNNWYALDTDIFWYPFLINFKQVDQSQFGIHYLYDHYVFSCSYVCDPNNQELRKLQQTYAFTHLQHPEAQIYVFDLKKKNPELKVLPTSSTHVLSTKPQTVIMNESFVKKMYRKLRDFLNAPQI